jgi:hypothetical protein
MGAVCARGESVTMFANPGVSVCCLRVVCEGVLALFFVPTPQGEQRLCHAKQQLLRRSARPSEKGIYSTSFFPYFPLFQEPLAF